MHGRELITNILLIVDFFRSKKIRYLFELQCVKTNAFNTVMDIFIEAHNRRTLRIIDAFRSDLKRHVTIVGL